MPNGGRDASDGTPTSGEDTRPPPVVGLRRQPCRCLWRGSAHTTKTTPRRRTILHLSQMRRTLARTFILAIVATVAYAFNGNEETDGKPSTIETLPPDPQGGGYETARKAQKKLVRPTNLSQRIEKPPCCGASDAHAPSDDGTDSPSPGGRVKTSGPFGVMAIVCSKWALASPSIVD